LIERAVALLFSTEINTEVKNETYFRQYQLVRRVDPGPDNLPIIVNIRSILLEYRDMRRVIGDIETETPFAFPADPVECILVNMVNEKILSKDLLHVFVPDRSPEVEFDRTCQDRRVGFGRRIEPVGDVLVFPRGLKGNAGTDHRSVESVIRHLQGTVRKMLQAEPDRCRKISIDPVPCLEHHVYGSIQMGTDRKVLIISGSVEPVGQITRTDGKTEIETEVFVLVKREVDIRHGSKCAPHLDGPSQSGIPEADPDDRVVESPFPFMFSESQLMYIYLECGKMRIEMFKFQMVGIEEPVVCFPFDVKVPVEKLMLSLPEDPGTAKNETQDNEEGSDPGCSGGGSLS
jgi:hypothetical protein